MLVRTEPATSRGTFFRTCVATIELAEIITVSIRDVNERGRAFAFRPRADVPGAPEADDSRNVDGVPDEVFVMLQAHMKFPPDYPYSPPSIRFMTKVWHPNVYEVSEYIRELSIPRMFPFSPLTPPFRPFPILYVCTCVPSPSPRHPFSVHPALSPLPRSQPPSLSLAVPRCITTVPLHSVRSSVRLSLSSTLRHP